MGGLWMFWRGDTTASASASRAKPDHLCDNANGRECDQFEDPWLAMMMAAPGRKGKARPELRSFVYVEPSAGEVLLWESWLRHEVPLHMAEEDRISVSFNYG